MPTPTPTPKPSGSPSRSPAAQAEVAALQNALAGVHATLWAYALLAPKLGSTDRKRASSAYESYRDLRGTISEALADRRAEPVAAAAAYRLPFGVTGPTSARKLAGYLEQRCADVFGALVAGAASPAMRRFAARHLTDAYRRSLDWGASPQALPGSTD